MCECNEEQIKRFQGDTDCVERKSVVDGTENPPSGNANSVQGELIHFPGLVV